MLSMDPRDFEKLVASLLDDQGWEVSLTPRTKDGGRDIVANRIISGIKFPMIVECKRWNNPIGVSVMRTLLGTVFQDMRESCKGVLATTSRFTPDAHNFIFEQAHVGGRDFDDLVDWLSEWRSKRRL